MDDLEFLGSVIITAFFMFFTWPFFIWYYWLNLRLTEKYGSSWLRDICLAILAFASTYSWMYILGIV